MNWEQSLGEGLQGSSSEDLETVTQEEVAVRELETVTQEEKSPKW